MRGNKKERKGRKEKNQRKRQARGREKKGRKKRQREGKKTAKRRQKIRTNLLFYLYFPPSFHLTVVCFCPVGLSLLIQHFQQRKAYRTETYNC